MADSDELTAEPIGNVQTLGRNVGAPLRTPKGQILPGQTSLNPHGRPRGSRNKLGEAFIADVYEDWKAHGLQALADARQNKPADYLKVIASILPREIKVSLDTLTESELDERISQLAESLGIEFKIKT